MRNRIISEEEYDRIIKHVDSSYRPLFVLCAETGYRIDDILKMRQYMAYKTKITIKEEKTGKKRTVTMTDKARAAALAQLSICVPRNPLGYLFQSRTARSGQRRKLHRSTAARQWAAAVKKAGLNGRGITVHSLRKLYATRSYAKTGSALAVMRDLGHDRITTTTAYLFDLIM